MASLHLRFDQMFLETMSVQEHDSWLAKQRAWQDCVEASAAQAPKAEGLSSDNLEGSGAPITADSEVKVPSGEVRHSVTSPLRVPYRGVEHPARPAPVSVAAEKTSGGAAASSSDGQIVFPPTEPPQPPMSPITAAIVEGPKFEDFVPLTPMELHNFGAFPYSDGASAPPMTNYLTMIWHYGGPPPSWDSLPFNIQEAIMHIGYSLPTVTGASDVDKFQDRVFVSRYS